MRTQVILLACLFSAQVFGQKKSKVVVDAPRRSMNAIEAAVGKKYEAVPAAQPLSDLPLTKEIREATAPFNAIAVILARPSARGYSIQVLSASDGTPIDTFEVKAAKKKRLKALSKSEVKQLLAALKEARANLPPPLAPEPASVDPVVAVEPEKTPEPLAAPAKTVDAPAAEPVVEVAAGTPAQSPAPNPEELRTAFQASFGVRGMNRSLTWDASKSDTLSNYSVPFNPAISVGATMFPAAPFTTSFIANIGLTTSADIAVGLSSQPIDNATRFGTSSVRYRIGAIVRFPISKTFELNAGAGYSSQTFSVATTSTDGDYTRPNSPGVAFNGPRFFVGVLISKLGPVSIDAGFGIVIPVGKGELAEATFFPKASAVGLDAAVGLSLEVVTHLQVRLGVDYARYFISANASSTGTLQARTAADQYLSGSLSLVFVL